MTPGKKQLVCLALFLGLLATTLVLRDYLPGTVAATGETFDPKAALQRYGFYFDSFEFLDIRRDVSSGALLPLDDLRKFDRMPALRRIYDNGDIVRLF